MSTAGQMKIKNNFQRLKFQNGSKIRIDRLEIRNF